MRVAILPAGGKQERTQGLLKSKHLLNLNGQHKVIDYALTMAVAAKANTHIITHDSEIARYAEAFEPFISMPWPNQIDSVGSLKWAYEDAACIFVMPDTCFGPRLIGEVLLDAVEDCGVAVALFKTDEFKRFGMCEVTSEGNLHLVEDKPGEAPDTDLAWGLIAWRSPLFWECIQGCGGNNMSDVLNDYIKHGTMKPKTFMLRSYRDIASVRDYEKALEEGW